MQLKVEFFKISTFKDLIHIIIHLLYSCVYMVFVYDQLIDCGLRNIKVCTKNFDESLVICQIHQTFPHQTFVL